MRMETIFTKGACGIPQLSIKTESPCRELMKKFIILLLAAAAMLTISACSGTQDAATEEPSAAQDNTETGTEAAADEDNPELDALKPVVWDWALSVYNESLVLSEMGTYEATYATEAVANGDGFNATVALESAIDWVNSSSKFGEVTKDSLAENYDKFTKEYEEIKAMSAGGTEAAGLREEAGITYKAYSDMYKAVTKPTETNTTVSAESMALISGSVPIIASVCGEALN